MKRTSLLAFIGATLFAAWLSSADTGETQSDPELIVIYLSGWQTSLNEPADFLNAWKPIQDAIEVAVPGRVRAVPYSYTYQKGSYENPPKYKPYNTNQSLDASADALSNQLTDLGSRYPRARFLLVGHSLGGVVASYWAGKTPSSSMRRVAGVITFDSPVEGVAWLDVYRALVLANVVTGRLGEAAGLAVLRGLFDQTLGEGGPVVDQLDKIKTPETFETVEGAVTNLRTAGGVVYNGFECWDLFIFCTDARTPGAEWKEFKLAPFADCRTVVTQLDVAHFGNQALLPDFSDSVEAGISARLEPEKVKKCYTEMHSRVLQVPEAGAWVAGIAKAVLTRPEPPVTPSEAPGGVWVTAPAENTVITSSQLYLEARAYPSAAGSPAVSQVNFTTYIRGGWSVACESKRPVRADVYACTVDLRNVPRGEFRVSFDVYDMSGSYRLAPNGVRTLQKPSEVVDAPTPSDPPKATPSPTPTPPKTTPSPTPTPPKTTPSPTPTPTKTATPATATPGAPAAPVITLSAYTSTTCGNLPTTQVSTNSAFRGSGKFLWYSRVLNANGQQIAATFPAPQFETSSTDPQTWGLCGPPPGQKYCFKVQMIDQYGTSPVSNEACTEVTPGRPPVPPSDMHAGQDIPRTTFYVQWDDNSDNEVGFEVVDCVAPYCSQPQINIRTGSNITTVETTSFPKGTYKCFYVRSFNQYGASAWVGGDVCATIE